MLPWRKAAAQSYTQLYYHDPARDYVYTDATVLEEFRWAPNSPYQGVVVFKPLSDNGLNRMQVYLVDQIGNIVPGYTKTYELPSNQEMIPIAAAYQSIEKRYIVMGECRSYIGNTSHATWYMILDEDLNTLLPATIYNFELLTAGNPTIQHTFVTDVCPVYHENGVQFAATGVVLEGSADPDVSSANPANRKLFIAKINAVTPAVVDWRMYSINYFATDATRFTYPSRIAAIKHNINPGYIIGGTTKNAVTANGDIAFYFRTDNSLTITAMKTIDDDGLNLPDVNTFSIGDLIYDENKEEIYVAGTILNEVNSADRFYFFDRLDNVGGGINVDSYADTWLAGAAGVGVYRLPFNPLNGFPKVGRIGLPNPIVNDACVITAVLNENNPGGLWLPTSKLPHLLYVHYDNGYLANWTTIQNTVTDLYPRQLNSGNPVPYYNAHGYWKPFYPNHTSFEYFNLFPKYYCLGGLTLDPIAGGTTDELLCLNVTYPVNFNACYFIQENVIAEEISVDISTNQTVIVHPNPANQIAQGALTVSMPNWIEPVNLDCQNTPFKGTTPQAGSLISAEIYFHQVVIKGLSENTEFRLFTSTGALVKTLSLDQWNNSFGTEWLPSGVYLLSFRENGVRRSLKISK